MKSLTAKQILQAIDFKLVEVPVPEWGGSVYIGSMTGAERGMWESGNVEFDSEGNTKINMDSVSLLKVSLLVYTLKDENNNRLFTRKDLNKLAEKNSIVIESLYDKAAALNGIGEEVVEELENFS